MKIIYFIPFFLITILPEFGFMRLGFLSVGSLFGIIIIHIKQYKIKTSYIRAYFIFSIIVLLQFLFSVIFGQEPYPFLYLIVLFSALNSLILLGIFDNINKEARVDFVNKALTIHVVIFIIQILSWYILKFDFDPGYYVKLSLSPHRAFHYDGTYRPTGIFTEPSIYSSYILALVAIYFTLVRKLNLLCWIALLTCLLSFSTIATFQVLAFILVCYYRFKIKYIITIFLLVSIILYGIVETLVARYDLFLKGSDGSNNFKIELLSQWFENNEWIYFGFGFVTKGGKASFFQALGDLGLFLNNVMIFGIVLGGFLTIWIVYWLWKSSISIRSKLLLLIVTLKLSTFTSPILIFFIGLFLSRRYRKNV